MSVTARSDVHVSHHQLLVVDQDGLHAHPQDVPNGLTAAVPGAAVIRTGIHSGVVDVTVRLATSAPPRDTEGWDEVEEVELISFTGETMLIGLLCDRPELPGLTPQGPGRYGMRVQVRGRDIDPCAVPRVPFEFYLVTVWPIDVGPEACARLGIGVAEELGLPGKADLIRQWALEHGSPQQEPGRLAGRERPMTPPVPVRAPAVTDEHRLRIVNPYQDTAAAPSLPGGLVAAAPDSVAIRTLKRRGVVGVHVRWELAAPLSSASGWEEVEEIEFVTTTGVMHFAGVSTDDERRPNLTFQGAGRYRLRVHGRARPRERLGNRPGESYLLAIWPIALGAQAAG
ncbi:hypothetical protein [Nonomuraea zeae]|uniref:Uncharacterized protein n=1 Tax=Nonomuraea zeae TaxID=1642303 RepID=A0A5S4H3T2_9ACTN|nr:hypothetical protein [Nonomuraea zeae]TMR39669.1 hypothetical protein ETD85_01275 [Nonomuraea zeae]